MRRHQRCSRLAHYVGRAFLALTGWQVEGEVPDEPRLIIIAAPHTSNWDFIYLLAAAYSFNISVNFLAKDSLFKQPLGTVMRFLGGIAIDRSKPNSVVSSLAEEIRHLETCAIVIPPAGSRRWTPNWKSGFYWIAREADIPVACSFLDFRTRTTGFGPTVKLSGKITEDMDQFRTFYRPITGKFPELKSVIKLREEEDQP